MRHDEILRLPAMPAASPYYPAGPFRFVDREYLIITYETEPAAIRASLPEPLEPDGSNLVLYEFIRMPDSSGFGSYAESGLVIPAQFNGEPLNFTAQMYLDNGPAIAAGRELWGFPKKYGHPRLAVVGDTLTGVLEYAGVQVAIGSMAYKHTPLCSPAGSASPEEIRAKLGKVQVNLRLIPNVDGSLAIAQLVSYRLTDITVKGAWSGAARLHLIPHANAPVADLPVRNVLHGVHILADLTLPYGDVLYDYLK